MNNTSPISGAPKPTPAPTPPPTSAMPNLMNAPTRQAPISPAVPYSNLPNIPTSTTTNQLQQRANYASSATNPNMVNNVNPSAANYGSNNGNPAASNFVFDSSRNIPKSSQRTDHFAEQNQKRLEKSQKASRTRKKVFKIGSIVFTVLLALALVGGIITFIIYKINHPDPEPLLSRTEITELADPNSTDITIKISNAAQELLQATNSTEEIQRFYDERIREIEKSSDGETATRAINTLNLLQMSTFAMDFDFEKVISISEKVNYDLLSNDQKNTYSGLLYNAYAFTGNQEKADYYYELSMGLNQQENSSSSFITYGSQ